MKTALLVVCLSFLGSSLPAGVLNDLRCNRWPDDITEEMKGQISGSITLQYGIVIGELRNDSKNYVIFGVSIEVDGKYNSGFRFSREEELSLSGRIEPGRSEHVSATTSIGNDVNKDLTFRVSEVRGCRI